VRKILLTGKNGQVGWELQRTLAPLGNVVAVDRQELDLGNPDSIRKAIREIRPELIVNAAAYTTVDKAESEPDLAMTVNGIAPGVMAEEAKRLNAAIIHYSTDYVFDGSKKYPYSEEDTPNPLNVYGKTKLAGERAIQAVGVPHLILRTSWVYGARGKNFLLTILKLARERSELKIVNDQFGAPTWSRMIAETTSQMLAQHYSPISRPSTSVVGMDGLYHLVSSGLTSWHGFASKIIEGISCHISHALPKLMPIPTNDYPLPAKRPLNSSMSNEKLKHAYGLTIPSWEHSLKLCLDELVISAV
jgi:dTDP-4-dehydrorhamnose reductase